METKAPHTGLALGGAILLAPRVGWAVEAAPDANSVGLLFLAVLVLAAGFGIWASLRERRGPDAR